MLVGVSIGRGKEVVMKIILWNVRGLGSVEKWKEVRNLVEEKGPSILCIQETKMPVYDDVLCDSLWAGTPHSFSYGPSVGASGGLLILWDCSLVEVWSTVSFERVVMIYGRFIQSNEEFYLCNVYAPFDNGEKQVLWEALTMLLQQMLGKNVCICGDFNIVQSFSEWRSLQSQSTQNDIAPFNRFIAENSLVDLPFCGRKYTWYKGDGSPMSRIDRFFLSED
jgi:exonuclease III